MRRRNLGWGLMSMPWSTEPNLLSGSNRWEAILHAKTFSLLCHL